MPAMVSNKVFTLSATRATHPANRRTLWAHVNRQYRSMQQRIKRVPKMVKKGNQERRRQLWWSFPYTRLLWWIEVSGVMSLCVKLLAASAVVVGRNVEAQGSRR